MSVTLVLPELCRVRDAKTAWAVGPQFYGRSVDRAEGEVNPQNAQELR
jgi:hypothetical protein